MGSLSGAPARFLCLEALQKVGTGGRRHYFPTGREGGLVLEARSVVLGRGEERWARPPLSDSLRGGRRRGLAGSNSTSFPARAGGGATTAAATGRSHMQQLRRRLPARSSSGDLLLAPLSAPFHIPLISPFSVSESAAGG